MDAFLFFDFYCQAIREYQEAPLTDVRFNSLFCSQYKFISRGMCFYA